MYSITLSWIYDGFDYKNAEKYYSIEIGYIVDDYTNLIDLDEKIDTHMKKYNAIWTASDCGPFSISMRFKESRMMFRCNNYSIYDMDLNLNEFKSKLPKIFFIDSIHLGYINNDEYRFKRIKKFE